jgi:hypothetical protein
LLLPEWSWSAETITKAVLYDSEGNFLGSSAGEPFATEIPFTQPVLTIERYESWFDPSTIINFVNHVNSQPIWGGATGEVLCSHIEDRKDTHVVWGQQYYRKVRYVFKFAVPAVPEVIQGHDLLFVDQGTFYRDSNGNKVHFKAGGSDTTGLLNGHARQYTPAFAGDVILFSRAMYPKVNFNLLGFGLPI